MASTNFVGFFRNPLRFDSTFNFHFRFYYLLPIKHFIESDCLLDQHRSHACKHNVEIYSGASVFVKSFLCVTDLNISLKIWAPKYQYGLVNLDKLEAHMAPGVLKLFATLFMDSKGCKTCSEAEWAYKYLSLHLRNHDADTYVVFGSWIDLACFNNFVCLGFGFKHQTIVRQYVLLSASPWPAVTDKFIPLGPFRLYYVRIIVYMICWIEFLISDYLCNNVVWNVHKLCRCIPWFIDIQDSIYVSWFITSNVKSVV